MSFMQAGEVPAGAEAPISTIPREETREDRLEAIIRRMLPGVNLGAMGGDLRSSLFREFSELRTGGTFAQDIRFSDGRCLLWYDGPVISTVRADGREGLLMQVPEEEAGAYYILVVPAPKVMSALRSDQICLRTACLDEQSMLYLTDDCVEGEGRVLRGPVHEYLLPEEGLFMSEFYENPDEPEMPGGM